MKSAFLFLFAWVSLAGAAEEPPYFVYNNPPAKPQPLLTHHTYESRLMHCPVGYNLYLPPGYADSTQRYPVIYWCHGGGNTESSDQYPPQYLDAAIRDGKMPPTILVYVSGGKFSFYTDSFDGRYQSESTIMKELIPHIDATYRTIPGREGRAIQGMSMGGFGALRHALKYPEKFSSVVAYAGAYFEPESVKSGLPEIFQKIFGGEEKRFVENHTFYLARQNADRIRNKLPIRLYCGTKDPSIGPGRKMHQLLDELKIPHEQVEFPEVEHNLTQLSDRVKEGAFLFAARYFRLK